MIYVIKLKEAQVNIILAKLVQFPFQEVAEVIAAIKSQGDEQFAAATKLDGPSALPPAE